MGITAYLSSIFAPEPVKTDTRSGWKKAYDKLAAAGEIPELYNGPGGPGHGKPRLAAVTTAPSREAFDAWREHPVTLFVFAALREAARAQENTWAVDSWEAGNCDAALLSELRVRADAYNSMQEGSYEAFCEWAGVEPEGADDGAA